MYNYTNKEKIIHNRREASSQTATEQNNVKWPEVEKKKAGGDKKTAKERPFEAAAFSSSSKESVSKEEGWDGKEKKE